MGSDITDSKWINLFYNIAITTIPVGLFIGIIINLFK